MVVWVHTKKTVRSAVEALLRGGDGLLLLNNEKNLIVFKNICYICRKTITNLQKKRNL
jgi:hypothetical protein